MLVSVSGYSEPSTFYLRVAVQKFCIWATEYTEWWSESCLKKFRIMT
jgi:hypothetical protein